MFRRRLGLILILLALDTVLVLVAVNDVEIRHQLRTTSASLASAKTQLSDSQVSLKIVSSRLQTTLSLSTSAQAGLLRTQGALSNGLQTAIALLQGERSMSPGTIIVALPRVQGVGGAVILTPPPTASPSAVLLTTVINGAVPGNKYSIAWGECPEDLTTQTFGATSVAFEGGFAVLPTIPITLPDSGTRSWFRLHLITPPVEALSGVLGGVRGPFLQGPFGTQDTPVPSNVPAC